MEKVWWRVGWSGEYVTPFLVRLLKLKGVFAKNERGYRLNAIKKRF